MPHNNLAYDLDFEANAVKREDKVKAQKRENKAKEKARKAHLYRAILICLSVLALSAGFMISRKVAAYESKQNVEKLQKELVRLKGVSSQKTFELEKSIDREEIEFEAKTRLNMVKPERSQRVYVNVKQDDVTEVVAKDTEGFNFLNIFSDKR